MTKIQHLTLFDGKGKVYHDAGITFSERIEALEEKPAPDPQALDGSGLLLLPGFIDSLNRWGGVGPGWQEDDYAEISDPITPELDVSFAFDPDNMMFQELYRYGLTACGITPGSANVISGQIGAFLSYGRHPEKVCLRSSLGIQASATTLPTQTYKERKERPMTRMGSFALLREVLHKAHIYADKIPEQRDFKLEALVPIVHREKPLFINAMKRFEIEAALRIKDEFQLRMVLCSAYEIDEHLRKDWSDLAIIMGDRTDFTSLRYRRIDTESINHLAESGVPVAISSFSDRCASGKESLLWNAQLYQKDGVKEEWILPMITSQPAKILGIEDLCGSLEVGKRADFCLWSENPLQSFRARLMDVYVGGKRVDQHPHDCW